MGMESKECHAEMEKKERSERESGGGGNDLEEIHEICSPLIDQSPGQLYRNRMGWAVG